MSEVSGVVTYKLSAYPTLIEAVKRVRAGEEPVFLPEIGSEWDGLPILRVGKTIDHGWYLAVLMDGIMFYIVDDINALA